MENLEERPGAALCPSREKASGGEAIPGWATTGQLTAGWPRARCPAPEHPGSPVLPKRHFGRGSLHFTRRAGGWESRSGLRVSGARAAVAGR